MFKKYEKIYRIPIPQYDVKGKFFLNKEEVKKLLSGKVVVEEKMDGANVGIIRHKQGFHLQKRGSLVGPSTHEQFNFFYNWANKKYNDIMEIPIGYLVYAELLFAVHSIFYDKLPDYILVFDVWDGERFLDKQERNEFCYKYNFKQVPFIYDGYLSLEDLFPFIPDKSDCGEQAEGIIVKKYKGKEYFRGKIVKPEFIKHLDESDHWMNTSLKRNKVIE